MGTHQASTTIYAAPEVVFGYLSDVSHLPRYFHSMTRAEAEGGNKVEVEANLDGKEVTGEAWLEADDDQRTLRWGSPGPSDYHGELSVAEAENQTCVVTVTLHTERTDDPAIDAGLAETLSNLATEVRAQQH